MLFTFVPFAVRLSFNHVRYFLLPKRFLYFTDSKLSCFSRPLEFSF